MFVEIDMYESIFDIICDVDEFLKKTEDEKLRFLLEDGKITDGLPYKTNVEILLEKDPKFYKKYRLLIGA